MAIVSGEALADKIALNDTLRSVIRIDAEVQEWMAEEIDGDTSVELEERIHAITPEYSTLCER
jgi:hypothetical protein